MKRINASSILAILSDNSESRASLVFNRIIIVLILLSVVLVVADTFEEMPVWYITSSTVAEAIIVIIFTAEYILRFWAAGYQSNKGVAISRLRYVFSWPSIIDLLAIMPFYIGLFFPANLAVLRTLRVLRLLRLVKAGRYTKALSSVGEVLKNKSHQLLSSLAMIGLLLVVASTLMYTLENSAQPDVFKNAFSGLWWAAVTVTTVGYGDMYPITPLGQLLGITIALLGIALVAVPTGIISAGFVEAQSKEKEKERDSASE